MTNKTIPINLDASILIPLLGHVKENKTSENYLIKIFEFERKCEKSIIETFAALNINGIVKSEPYSLPYTDEIVTMLRGESYMNGPYEFFRVARPVIKELLAKNEYKIRFYFYIEVETESGLFKHGSIKYHFRYYSHN